MNFKHVLIGSAMQGRIKNWRAKYFLVKEDAGKFFKDDPKYKKVI